MTPATCPHCGKETTSAALGRHAPVCMRNPANWSRLLAILTAEDGVGITYSVYEAMVERDNLPAITTLRRQTGTTSWDGVLAAFGLESPDEEQTTCPTCGRTFRARGIAVHEGSCCGKRWVNLATEVEQESALIAAEARILEQDKLQAQCLPACRVEPAPGLWVNGRPVVATMIR
jgi:adenine-specific DNA methylase